MKLAPWGEYRPDVADINGNHTRVIDNVLPRGDGYGPVKDLEAYSAALGATCRGAFRALNSDGSITVFAATATKLYKMDNTALTFENVSKTAGAHNYALPSDQQWQWAQYDDFVITVQGGDAPQVFEVGVSTNFADLAGSPPICKYISIVNEFVVLTGLVSFPYRAQWSGRSAPTTWTSGVTESDYQDFVDGGPTGPLGGGEHSGLLIQTTAMRRMTYQPGNPVIFSFDRVSDEIGILAPYSMVRAGQRIFFLSNAGFQMSIDGGIPTPIGKERVDNTFIGEWDDNNLQLTMGFADPRGPRVFFAYKTTAGEADLFNKILCYDYVLDRWTPISHFTGEFITSLAQVATTLEELDDLVSVVVTGDTTDTDDGITNLSSIAGLYVGMFITGDGIPADATIVSIDGADSITISDNATATDTGVTLSFGGSLDSLDVSSLDAFPVAFGREIAIFNDEHKLGFLTGDNIEATLETPEQGETNSQIFVSGGYPVSDADTIYGQASFRGRLGSAREWTEEQPMDDAGLIPARIDTRFSRLRNRIPASTSWTYSSGVLPLIAQTGKR
jgi:hypothetical protein